ncbi:MAG TPA: putative phage abortive infection protein, partial [Saprospiraceae bacterium]|nr:putative phage abortive infection protein [Saprospiraceae bacterium]
KYGDTVYFGGHQTRLAHYFRHLFHAVKFINDNKYINFVQKFEYIQILRAQLSIYEIAIFFFHSLSDLGEPWEKRKYVSNYALIRNLPPEFTKGISPEKYYKIKYQYDNKT